MPQRGTDDSLYDLMTHIYNESSLKKIVLMVSLDIEGACNNTWWPAIRNQLLTHKCPANLYGMVIAYLIDWEVVVCYAGGESRKMTSKGCIQDSIAGPIFWNLVLTTRTRRPRRIRAGVRGRRGPHVFWTVGLGTGGGS
ncbi:hypothetical protein EVAR_96256_1 [Eumeta japonica]|uniref:Uncharacterized protein n=1 Tax=Eumeta variegata TaxID=151549 RepID=A0A4C1WNK8_EUMVA|nr:hypothetical protein EVAR_96256_1 [Eumeta japonica]